MSRPSENSGDDLSNDQNVSDAARTDQTSTEEAADSSDEDVQMSVDEADLSSSEADLSSFEADLSGSEVDLSISQSDESRQEGDVAEIPEGNNTDQGDNDDMAAEVMQNAEDQDRVEDFESVSSVEDLDGASEHNNTDDEIIRGDFQPANVLDDSFQTDDSDDDENGVDEDQLFEGSRLSLKEYMLAVLSFSTRHKLSGMCLSDLLQLVEMLCPPNNKCVKSLYKFKKYFAQLGTVNVVYHYFCSHCEGPLESANDECEHCEGPQEVSYFLEIPVIPQLQAMFMRPGFYDALRYRFNRNKKSEGNIEDVFDGDIYQAQFQNGFLDSPNSVSFMWYTDGIAIYKSSNFSVWPMFLVNNEMKYKDRTKRENIIFAGLWFGSSKPNPNVFLEPLNKEFEELQAEGHLFERSDGPPVLVRARLLLGTGDLQAKCRCMCFRQWNGYFGCLKCLIRGQRFFITPRNSIHVYPYSRNVDLRTNDEIPDFAAQAVRNRQFDPDSDVYGVKALSRLYLMLPDMISCMAIDYMHGLSGVTKTLGSLWFESAYVGEQFSLYHVLDIIEKRLKSLRPPDFVQRMPQSIRDFAQWKCQEFKLFLLYYSVPLLVDILPENLWHHHCKLVSAIYTLLQESISREQVNETRDLLHSYVEDFQRFYGLRHMSMNVHNLLHYSDGVRDLGPLWVYDCFCLEDLNGKVAALVHGSRHAALQISSSAIAFLTLPARLMELDEGNVVRSFCDRMLASGQRHVRKVCEINREIFVASSFMPCSPIPVIVRDALHNYDLNIVNGRCKYFSRIMKKNVLYVAASYRNVQKLSCYAVIRHGNGAYVCKIENFVMWSPCNQGCRPKCEVCPRRYFFLVEIYERIPWEAHDLPDVSVTHLDRVERTGVVRVFPVESESTLCFFMSVNGYEYVGVPVNLLEAE